MPYGEFAITRTIGVGVNGTVDGGLDRPLVLKSRRNLRIIALIKTENAVLTCKSLFRPRAFGQQRLRNVQRKLGVRGRD